MTEGVAAQPASGAPGPQLKAEREKRGMSLQKAADELHLDAWVIEALESGDYQRIGATVYAKGHLKRYAGLLGLPAAAIMAGYETRAPAAPAVTLTSQSARMAGATHEPQMSNLSPGKALGAVVGLIVVVGIFWWRPWHQRVGAQTAVPTAAANPVAAPPAATEPESAAASLPAVDSPKASPAMVRDNSRVSSSAAPIATAVPASMTTPVSDANPATQPGAGRARLRLSFSAASWVEVHDATGKSVFAGNGAANSVKSIAGAAPMRVYLGAGSGVALEINDRAVAIGPQFFAGDVARFEAGADGVLRRDVTRNARPRG
jgi:cytoskeleton protein RodZ